MSRARIDHAEVALDRDADDEVAIGRAFMLREPPGPERGRVWFALERIEIDDVRVHGAVAPPLTLDGTVARLTATLEVSPDDGVVVDVYPTPIDVDVSGPRRAVGEGTYHLKRTGPGAGQEMTASFAGSFGGVDVRAAAGLLGDRIEGATLAVTRATPAAIAALLPDGPLLRVPVSAEVELGGRAVERPLRARLAFDGGGSIDAAGTLATGGVPSLVAAVAVHAVDPRVALDVASATPVDAAGHVAIAMGRAPGTIDADARTQPFLLAGHLVPGVDARASRAHGVWSGLAGIHELGAPAEASFSYDPRVGLDFEVEAAAARCAPCPASRSGSTGRRASASRAPGATARSTPTSPGASTASTRRA